MVTFRRNQIGNGRSVVFKALLPFIYANSKKLRLKNSVFLLFYTVNAGFTFFQSIKFHSDASVGISVISLATLTITL